MRADVRFEGQIDCFQLVAPPPFRLHTRSSGLGLAVQLLVHRHVAGACSQHNHDTSLLAADAPEPLCAAAEHDTHRDPAYQAGRHRRRLCWPHRRTRWSPLRRQGCAPVMLLWTCCLLPPFVCVGWGCGSWARSCILASRGPIAALPALLAAASAPPDCTGVTPPLQTDRLHLPHDCQCAHGPRYCQSLLRRFNEWMVAADKA